nr:hypothetical protein [Micromonospora sp. DSM 115978]
TLVGELVADQAAASTVAKALGTGLVAGGVAQLGAHWVREGYRSVSDARAVAADEGAASAASALR